MKTSPIALDPLEALAERICPLRSGTKLELKSLTRLSITVIEQTACGRRLISEYLAEPSSHGYSFHQGISFVTNENQREVIVASAKAYHNGNGCQKAVTMGTTLQPRLSTAILNHFPTPARLSDYRLHCYIAFRCPSSRPFTRHLFFYFPFSRVSRCTTSSFRLSTGLIFIPSKMSLGSSFSPTISILSELNLLLTIS